MIIKNVEKAKTKVIFPRGNWGQDLERLIREAGLTFERGQKGLVGEISELNLLVALLRPGDVLRWLTTENAQAVFGVTGTDCQQEFALETAQAERSASVRKAIISGLSKVELPQPYQQNPLQNQPRVQVFASPNSTANNQQELLEQQGSIATTFPQITKQWIKVQAPQSPVQVTPMSGSLEGSFLLTQQGWRGTSLPQSEVITGVVDVMVSGQSARDSGLIPLASIMAVELVGLLSEQATPTDRARVQALAAILNETNYSAINRYYNTGNYRNGSGRPSSVVPSVLERFSV